MSRLRRGSGCSGPGSAFPTTYEHRPMWRLALDMLAELADRGLIPPVVVADAGYGTNAMFSS